MEYQSDFLVIGSGIAGLSFALKAARLGTVNIVTKKQSVETSTNLAQGGIATVLCPEDSFDLHIKDTLVAGDGLCHEDVVQMVVRGGPERLNELIEIGVEFDKGSEIEGCDFDLGVEGGHSRPRIIHARDMTGKAIEEALLAKIEAHPNIKIFEDHLAIDLVVQSLTMKRGGAVAFRKDRCFGAYVLNTDNGEVQTFSARFTLLCTGGAGKVYVYTSNPDIATGDGIAMAWRAGAEVGNMEFVQFHPTCLYHPHAKNFLISEAVRGEGGRLIDLNGNTFMEKYHPLKELACRDVVARAIDSEMKLSGADCVYLDITHLGDGFIKERFPWIHRKCRSLGIDITKEPIPVVPAAHYICGGIRTDTNGLTSIKGLYAIGETAFTGLHGANRLASNSLLEAMVFSHAAFGHVERIVGEGEGPAMPEVPAWDEPANKDSRELVLISHNWDIIRRIMWNYVGIVRTDKRLMLAKKHISHILSEIDEHYPNIALSSDLIELKNLARVADIIVSCALLRKESRGLHFNADHPAKDDANFNRDTLVTVE